MLLGKKNYLIALVSRGIPNANKKVNGAEGNKSVEKKKKKEKNESFYIEEAKGG